MTLSSTTNNTLKILHHNVQPLSNKVDEMEVMLSGNLSDVAAMCFTEHWLKEDNIKNTKLENFYLASYFCRTIHNSGGSCIYVRKGIRYKCLSHMIDISKEKERNFGSRTTRL